ncbi:MAG: hypothetical protein ACTHJ0_14085 [Flavipsychrobacter sp.]
MKKIILIALVCFAGMVAKAQTEVDAKNSLSCSVHLHFIAINTACMQVASANVTLSAMTGQIYNITSLTWSAPLPAGAAIGGVVVTSPCGSGASVGDVCTGAAASGSFVCPSCGTSNKVDWVYSSGAVADLALHP